MDVRIDPRPLRGTVTPPPSKSMAHRTAIAQLLSGEKMTVPPLNRDLEATLRCGEALQRGGVLDCGESGSTLRFFLPIALALRGGGVFTGQGRLLERPLEPYFALFDEKGIVYTRQPDRLTVRGTLPPGRYALPGNVSSQFVTGLLFALPLLNGNSVLELTTPLESRGYVDLTLDTLRQAGVRVEPETPRRFRIPGPQSYGPISAELEADWSQGAFWFAANFLGSEITVSGLRADSAQGDRCIAGLSRRLKNPGTAEIDVSGCPDLLPPLAVMAAARRDGTRFVNAGRLRMKESDRLETVSALLRTFGVPAEAGPDTLTVYGPLTPWDGPIEADGAKDHRIVMAAAVLASAGNGPVTIHGAEAVEKSYPGFFTDYQRLGGQVHGF